jgi:hypothetical protein
MAIRTATHALCPHANVQHTISRDGDSIGVIPCESWRVVSLHMFENLVKF